MRLLVGGIIVTALLLAFVFVWIYLASLGQVPVIHAPLESVSPIVRIVVMLALAAVIGVVYFTLAPSGRKSQ
jgi:hypothetical protein